MGLTVGGCKSWLSGLKLIELVVAGAFGSSDDEVSTPSFLIFIASLVLGTGSCTVAEIGVIEMEDERFEKEAGTLRFSFGTGEVGSSAGSSTGSCFTLNGVTISCDCC